MLKTIVMAIRPKTLGAAVAPVLMGTAMAYSDGKMHILSAVIAFVGALLIQIGTNLANDYFDFLKGADEERVGPVRVTQAGLVSPAVMKWSWIVVFGLAALAGVYLVMRGGWPLVWIGVLSIASGILYTGGPYPLGYLGLGDVFVLIFFGPVAVGGTYYVQAQSIHLAPILAGLAPGLISTALLAVNNLRDVHTDVKVGKRTLAVRFGATFARWEFALSLIIAALVPVGLSLWLQGHYYVMFSLLGFLVLIPAFRRVFGNEEGAILNEALAQTGKYLLVFGVLFSALWVI